ncbi:hypothetical protein L596_014812 [Steinernema carpocapsae]|uniref:Corticotropin-releasing factor domain-containing protein n=1 Tax=Steinernema carpocapsae TaxID=34508 RepID=A0A4U5NDK3_STECR|nr:hypothetical protein L596_014812 [Steinernema carpocapsae]
MVAASALQFFLFVSLAFSVFAFLPHRPLGFVQQKKTSLDDRFSQLSETQYQAVLQHLMSRQLQNELRYKASLGGGAAFAPVNEPSDLTFRRAIQNILMKKYMTRN